MEEIKLSGCCKEDFEKWYREYQNRKEDIPSLKSAMPWFYSLDFSMQYGVYVDFFDEHIIHFYIEPSWLSVGYFKLWIFDGSFAKTQGVYPTRHEARAKAIEKANEIYNQTK